MHLMVDNIFYTQLCYFKIEYSGITPKQSRVNENLFTNLTHFVRWVRAPNRERPIATNKRSKFNYLIVFEISQNAQLGKRTPWIWDTKMCLKSKLFGYWTVWVSEIHTCSYFRHLLYFLKVAFPLGWILIIFCNKTHISI